MTWVAGADGCPAGWLVVFRSTTGQLARARIFAKIIDALTAPEEPKIVAIDIPIGLPRISEQGGRAADREARKVLCLRKSSIFPAPSRSVLQARSFREAKALETRNSRPPKKIGLQVFNLICKIREVDKLVTSNSKVIFECHPEVSFWAMNNKIEMQFPKRKLSGFQERCDTLVQSNYERSFLTTRVGSYKEHSRDDLLDACVAAWTAERIFNTEAIRFPMKPDPDGRKIDPAIWA